jgi:NAD(P) transhydrogenase subunit beta
MENLSHILYLIAAICFIMGIKGLASPKTARNGNMLAIIGMVIAIATTIKDFSLDSQGYILLIIMAAVSSALL